jgi:hypothetical protein
MKRRSSRVYGAAAGAARQRQKPATGLCPLLVRSQSCSEAASSQDGAPGGAGRGLARERGGRRFGNGRIVAKDKVAKTAIRLRNLEAERKIGLVQRPSTAHSLTCLKRDDLSFESSSRFNFSPEHDLFRPAFARRSFKPHDDPCQGLRAGGKPVSTFRDHALKAPVRGASRPIAARRSGPKPAGVTCIGRGRPTG